MRRGNEQPAVLFPILLPDRKMVKNRPNRGRGYNCPIVWDYNLQQCTFWKQHVYVCSIVFYYCGTLNGVTVQLFFHHFQGQTSDNELLHWMMMMLGSAAFVIVGICFVKKGGGREYPFHFDKCNKNTCFWESWF